MRNLLLTILLAAGAAHSQIMPFQVSGGFEQNRDGGYTAHASFRPDGPGRAVKANAPYSGRIYEELVILGLNGQPDRKVINSDARPTRIWRDTAGRTRVEQSLGLAGFEPTIITCIDNPASGYGFVLDQARKVAHRVTRARANSETGPPTPLLAGQAPPAPPLFLGQSPGAPGAVSEDLGIQLISGVPARGTRTTVVIPAGQRGNDRPMTNVREDWFSPDLGLTVRTEIRSSGSNSVHEIKDLSRSEPAADLFHPPPDYQVVDETGAFTITWKVQQRAGAAVPAP